MTRKIITFEKEVKLQRHSFTMQPRTRLLRAVSFANSRALPAAQDREGEIGRSVDDLEERPRRSTRGALALLPVADGLDRHFDAGGQLGLGQPGGGADATGIGREIAVVVRRLVTGIGRDRRTLAAIRPDLHDPAISLETETCAPRRSQHPRNLQ